MLILIFDTDGGLCNQFFDINNGINFCLKNNVFFTFRHCAFRNDNLITWTEQPFEKLFDISVFNKYNLYINYYDIKNDLTDDNCFNLNDKKIAWMVFKHENILNQLINLNKKYVVLKQIAGLNQFKNFVDYTVNKHILPSNHIMEKYNEIKNVIINEPYNFIHYRYEKDFTSFFHINVETLDSVIEKVKFKNNGLKIYIATTNIKTLINLKDSKYQNLLYKNDDLLGDLNFEQRAFIDYMFGLNSIECYGHKNSSFSNTLNNLKQTNNYYNLL